MNYRSICDCRFLARVQVKHRSAGAEAQSVDLKHCNISRLIMLRVCASQLRLAAPQATRTPAFLAPSACPCLPTRWSGVAPDLLRPASKRNRSFSASSSRLVTMAAAATLYDFQAKVRQIHRCYPSQFAGSAAIEVMMCLKCCHVVVR
jgi:hypothetical protein